MTNTIFHLILLCLGTTFASEVHYYMIRPSQSQNSDNRFSTKAAYVDNDFTLSQFINNSSRSDYLTNHTRLIFSPGNYSLESELVVENVHSFSIVVWPGSSSKAVITCGHNARFEFTNVGTVTVSGLEFVGCFENHVISVSQFQLENSEFYGSGQAIVSGRVLTIEESVAYLNRVAFVSVVDKQELSCDYRSNCSILDQKISAVNRVIGILSRSCNISITHSRFEGNNMGLIGAVLYDEFGSDIVITNTTFINNSASDLYVRYACRCYSGCNNITSGIVYTSGHGSSVKIYDSTFVQNEGIVIFGENCTMLITHTMFMNNMNSGYFVVTVDSNLVISHSIFINNTGPILNVRNTNMSVSHSEFISNQYGYKTVYVNRGMITSIDHSRFINNTGNRVLDAENTNVSISQSEFISNENYGKMLCVLNGTMISIDHSRFISNTGFAILDASNTTMVSVTHSEFIDNTAIDMMLDLDGVMITLSLNEFINNNIIVIFGVMVGLPFYTRAENLTDNVFIDNSAGYELFISSSCRPNLGLSLDSSRCIPCSENWRQDLIGIVVAAFIAGIALVISMLALNMTIAVGTLNGILFYANIVAANADTYFLPFTTNNFITVFISWLNLDIGFDICFAKTEAVGVITLDQLYKALLQLAFPVYVIFLVIIVMVASECSSKFAKIIGKGNPVAVLATVILLSYAKFGNVILTSLSLMYLQPAYGSRNVDVTRFIEPVLIALVEQSGDPSTMAATFSFLIFSALVLLLYVAFTVLVFSWQWLLQYQDKAIFKWVRYQKLRHFLEPYHAPYTANYRYWTGLLLLVRVLLYLISLLYFSLDKRTELMAIIFITGGLLLLRGVIAKRVYKNWPIDVMETGIYFNLVAFSALTWYNLDFGGNQVTVAYISVMIIFILLLGVIVFHVLRYTRLYKCSFVEKAFKWTTSKLLEKKPKEQPLNAAPEELDGYWLERPAAGDHELPTLQTWLFK